jgi:hypothetical protein
MRNKIDDLRNHLFETLEALKDDEKPMDLDRARAVAEVAKVIVESAKVSELPEGDRRRARDGLHPGGRRADAASRPTATNDRGAGLERKKH